MNILNFINVVSDYFIKLLNFITVINFLIWNEKFWFQNFVIQILL